MSKALQGMYAALLTGFGDDGAYSPERQVAITRYVAGQDLAGLYIGGSSAESGLMSTDELLHQQETIAGMRSEITGTVIAHVGQPSTRDAIRLAKNAKTLGFDAISALPPHAYPFSDAEILGYYRDLSDAVDLPMIVYEIPLRTNRPLPIELLNALLTLPNTVGMKFTSTDLYKLSLLRDNHPDMLCFYGFDEMYGAAAALGCAGGIGTTYNVLGSLYTKLHAVAQAGDPAELQRLQKISRDYVAILSSMSVVPGVKASLRLLGVDAGEARRPMPSITDEQTAVLKDFLAREDVSPWLNQEAG